MEMFLMVLALSLVGVAVSAVVFVAAVRQAPPQETRGVRTVTRHRSRFFADAPTPALPRVPIEVLLLQIERHVRLEQAAAESFHAAPTIESLHSRTMSPLVH